MARGLKRNVVSQVLRWEQLGDYCVCVRVLNRSSFIIVVMIVLQTPVFFGETKVSCFPVASVQFCGNQHVCELPVCPEVCNSCQCLFLRYISECVLLNLLLFVISVILSKSWSLFPDRCSPESDHQSALCDGIPPPCPGLP